MKRFFTRNPRGQCTRCPLGSSNYSTDNLKKSSNHVYHPKNLPSVALLPQQKALSESILRSDGFSRRHFIPALLMVGGASVAATYALFSLPDHDMMKQRAKEFYVELEQSLEKSNNSAKKVFDRIRHTGVATTVLWKSLRSVLSSANQEVRSGFELRVASLLADIAAASENRRVAIVEAGGGAVVDWLLATVAASRNGTQEESARALAYLIADPTVSTAVLGRAHAVPNLLRFIFSFQPHRAKKHTNSTLGGSGLYRGRSMLVAAIMDIITSNCETVNHTSHQPSLSGDAKLADIAAVIQVIEEGCMHLDEHEDDSDNVGGNGLCGIGMKVLGGTSVVGFSRTNDSLESSAFLDHIHGTSLMAAKYDNLRGKGSITSLTTPGLWDDLQREHVAVPFAAWALANWAQASAANRFHIQELDRDGCAIMTALIAPERTVRWHACLAAKLLLEDSHLLLAESIHEWSSILLSAIFQASFSDDIALVRIALSAFLVSLGRSSVACKIVREKRLDQMRQCAKRTEKYADVQEGLAKGLELLSMGDCHLSLEDSQKWSSILLSWVCGRYSTDATRSSATGVLSCVLEDYGPALLPISQGWLTVLLREILETSKASRRNSLPKSEKVKTQIDQSNVVSAAQIANQMAAAVVNLVANQFGHALPMSSGSPFIDFLSLEPFAEQTKKIKKECHSKFDVADSAIATLKGIKAITEICAEDFSCQKQIADLRVLCLLRRFLLRDDYEQLAAAEAYDASRIRENHVPPRSDVPSVSDANVPIRVRVPPTAHIRKHAARLLAILSLLPNIQEAIKEDKIWCQWLEDCAKGEIPGCNDLKLQSYARTTLLNVFCSQVNDGNVENDHFHGRKVENSRSHCPRYEDKIFLINPELSHWKCPAGISVGSCSGGKDAQVTDAPYRGRFSPLNDTEKHAYAVDQPLDIVFVHGLRGGPFKTWRIAEDRASTRSKSGLVEKIDLEAGKEGTCWPREWLSVDFPHARLFTVKYKTNLTQWSGASLPLQEVSSMLLKKLAAAGIGYRPVVFVTHSLGGLVMKQMLYQAKTDNFKELLDNTIGVVFYSCPHFGSKLADMPWRMGLVLRPAPTVGELRSGSPRLEELNHFMRQLYNKGQIDVLSFSETMDTPIVEGYGGWAFRIEVVPIESAYPGFGELVEH